MGLILLKEERTELGLTSIRIATKWIHTPKTDDSFQKKEKSKGFFGKLLEKGKDLVNSAMEGEEEKIPDFDVDTSILQLTKGKLRDKDRLVYYGGPYKDANKHIWNENRSIHHYGDNRVGGSIHDDEVIDINLLALPSDVDSLQIVSNIYECVQRNQHFGMLHAAYVRILNPETNEEICRFNLIDLHGYTAIDVGRLYKERDAWMFHAKGIASKHVSLQSMIASI